MRTSYSRMARASSRKPDANRSLTVHRPWTPIASQAAVAFNPEDANNLMRADPAKPSWTLLAASLQIIYQASPHLQPNLPPIWLEPESAATLKCVNVLNIRNRQLAIPPTQGTVA
jgi:hypothetical protein